MQSGDLVTVERQVSGAPLGEFEYCFGILVDQPSARYPGAAVAWHSWNVLVDGILITLPMRMIEVQSEVSSIQA